MKKKSNRLCNGIVTQTIDLSNFMQSSSTPSENLDKIINEIIDSVIINEPPIYTLLERK